MANRARISLAVVLGLGLFAVASQPAAGAGVPLGSLGYFQSVQLKAGTWGPWSTAANNGYEPSDLISPMVPHSYAARRAPSLYAVQFVADDPHDLRRDGLTVALSANRVALPHQRLSYNRYDLVGRSGSGRLWGKAVRSEFRAERFQKPPTGWVVEVARQSPHAAEASPPFVEALAALNGYRRLLGETLVGYNPNLASAAGAHAKYLATNGYQAPSFHDELAGHPDYTGINPWTRDMAMGWPSSLAGEVGIEWSQPVPAPIVVQDLVDTVYHRLDLFSDNLYSEGEGTSTGPTGAVVMDLGYGYGESLPPVVVYPYPGQMGVPIAWTDLESPDPMPEGFGGVYGYPLTIDFPTVARLYGASFSLRDGDQQIPSVFDRPGQGEMDENQGGLVPLAPLPMDAELTASFSAQAVFQQGTVAPVHRLWHFATGGAAVSVTAVPRGHDRVDVAVSSTGGGIGWARTPVWLFRGRRRMASGRTNADGLVCLRTAGPGTYRVKVATGNAIEFTEGGARRTTP